MHSFIDENGFWIRKMYWPEIGLATHHEPEPKKKILKTIKVTGRNINKLLTNDNLDYFNLDAK